MKEIHQLLQSSIEDSEFLNYILDDNSKLKIQCFERSL
jgi:hypothetical protein